jgi:ribonuclease-3
VVEVKIFGFQPATGTGRSKRIAEQLAAENMLCREGVWQR